MLRVSLALTFLVVVVSAGPSSAKESPFNVDFFCGWDGCFRPMEWTPVEIEIGSTLTEPFEGNLHMSAQQDGLNTMNIVHDFALTPDIRLYVPLVTKIAFYAQESRLSITNKRGRVQWSQDFNLSMTRDGARPTTVVNENDMLVGLVGQAKADLLRLGQKSFCTSYRGRGIVYVKTKLPRMVPWDWTGFVSLDLLILYDPDWERFKPQQLNGIAQWVSNGGRLLVVLGSHPLPPDSPVANLIPFDTGKVQQVTISAADLRNWGFSGLQPETVTCWPLTPKPQARVYDTEITDDKGSLFATCCVGFGRVGVLAFDPATISGRQRANAAPFWVGRIAAVVEDPIAARIPPKETSRPGRLLGPGGSYAARFAGRSIRLDVAEVESPDNRSRSYEYRTGTAQAASNSIMEYLYTGIKPLSIWWVILLLTALALLLGPIDYKILKRKDRLPLTWLTCAFWITIFTVGAYYGVQFLRAGDMELRLVSVVDGIDDGPAWATVHSGLFAPYSANYRFDGVAENQWWSGIAPTQEREWAYNRETGGRRIYCVQKDGSSLPYSVPINIWTVQCLLTESPVEQMPFDARLTRHGDRLMLEIDNRSNAAIIGGYLLMADDRGLDFGRVEAASKKQFEGPSRSISAWRNLNLARGSQYYYEGGTRHRRFKNENAFFAQGSLQRTEAIHAYLAHGAAVVVVEYDKAPVPFTVKGRSSRYEHIQLARLVVFPSRED